jgi:copper chaperone CopZ
VYRLEKAIQRLDGVDKVKVLMDPIRVDVEPRSGAWVEAERLRSAVKKAGFKPGTLRYVISGTLVEWRGQPALRLQESERVIVLQGQTEASQAFERARQALAEAGDRTAEVEGQFVDRAIAGDRKSPAALRVQRLVLGG